MNMLSEFIGNLVSDVSDARKIVDSNSAALSQSYHADPFLKGMPVPHYTIEEAEFKFPVSIMGIVSESKNKTLTQALIINAIRLKLPQLLKIRLINSYIEKKKAALRKENEKEQAAAVTNNMMIHPQTNKPLEDSSIEITDELSQKYADSSNKIAKNVTEPMNAFLNTANFEIIKMLDIKDAFTDILKPAIREEFSSYAPEYQPVNEDKLDELTAETGTAMFFEFKQLSDNNKGIFIDAQTGKINEYGDKNNLTFITLKIKEQDLDLVVEDTNGDGTQRFLSLN